MGELESKINSSVEYLRSRFHGSPELGLILGSGLGELAGELENSVSVGFGEIPGFREPEVEGHEGRLVSGELEDRTVCALQGRFHYYEGHSMEELVFPVRVLWGLDMGTLIVTNASGAVNTDFDVGEIVAIEDHINFMGNNPLIGRNDEAVGPRFVDMTEAYNRDLRRLAHEAAVELGMQLGDGVYAATTGPSYETPAEIEMFRSVGVDLVGMSTVPEVIAANHCGMDVLGLSCVTNMAAGVLDEPLDHEEVLETTERVKDDFKRLIGVIVRKL